MYIHFEIQKNCDILSAWENLKGTPFIRLVSCLTKGVYFTIWNNDDLPLLAVIV